MINKNLLPSGRRFSCKFTGNLLTIRINMVFYFVGY